MSYPVKVNGYIYSPRTKAGFLRMQRQGIPRPLFSIEDKMATILKSRYRALARKLLRDLRAQCNASNIILDAAPEDDSLESLLKLFFHFVNKPTFKHNINAFIDSIIKCCSFIIY